MAAGSYTNQKDCSHLIPRLVPDYFIFNKRCQIAAIYGEELGESAWDSVTLMFSGGPPGSAPIRVVPERVDSRTLLFYTPDYKTVQPTETVSVLPVMHTKTSDGRGDIHIDLPSFQIRVQNPARSMIEMSIEVFPQETLLPVLITFMLQYKGNKSPFQDVQFDKVMAHLVANRDLQNSSSIKDILRPAKKWQRMNIHEFSKEHNLTNTAEASKVIKEGRRLGRRPIQEPASVVRDLRSIYWSLDKIQPTPRQHPQHHPQDLVQDSPDASPVPLKKEQSGSSLGGEPIDLKNPPYHFRYPPGSGTESDSDAYAYSDVRIYTKYGDRNYNSDGNSSPAANRLRVPYSDSLDSGLNRVKHPSPVKKAVNWMPGHLPPASPDTPCSSPLQHTSTNTTAGSSATTSPRSVRDTPLPLPRPNVPAQLQPQSGSAGTAALPLTGETPRQQPILQQRPTPKPRHNLQTKVKEAPQGPAGTGAGEIYDDIVLAPRSDESPHVARQPRSVPKTPQKGL